MALEGKPVTGNPQADCEIHREQEAVGAAQPARKAAPQIVARNFLIVLGYVAVFWVLLPAFLFATGLRIDMLIPVPLGKSPVVTGMGYGLVLLGFLFMVFTMAHLWLRGKGLPISHLPPSQFVATGTYRYLRHPIYVGYTAAFAGAALLLQSFWSLAFSTPLLLIGWVSYALFYEEPALIGRFGARYHDYRWATPMLLPKGLIRICVRAMQPTRDRLSKWFNAGAHQTILFQHGNFILVCYGAFIAAGAILFMLITAACLLEHGVTRHQVVIYLIGAPLTTLVFSHAFWWLGHFRSMIRQPLLGMRNVGFVSWGNLAGLIVFTVSFAFAFDLSLLGIADDLMRGMFAGYAVGRLGCLTYGCCYGITTAKQGIRYVNPAAKVIRERGDCRLPRYPTQIYSFWEGVLLFALLNLMAYVRIPAGLITAAAFLLYPIGRALIEFFRDRERYVHGIFTIGHPACLAMFLTGWLLLFLVRPGGTQFAPNPLSLIAVRETMTLAPIGLMIAGIIFIATGFHWKRVGTW
jgi:prolipoprotein diacylglyceryltransferase/protein-S-isoprenylcysteine O-methyltransferase Ste14